MLILVNIIVLFGSLPALVWLLVHFEPTFLMISLLFIANAAMLISIYWLWARFDLNNSIGRIHGWYIHTPFETPPKSQKLSQHFSNEPPCQPTSPNDFVKDNTNNF